MITELHVLALVAYGLTGAFAIAPLVSVRASGGTLALATSSAAVTLHFGALLVYAQAAGMLPFTGLAPALSSLGFLVGLLACAIQWLTRERAIAMVAAPLVVVFLGSALAVGFGPGPASEPRGAWFVLHVASSFLGLAFLAVAFAASALYVLQYRELKARRFGAIFQFFPPLEQLDRLNHVALVTGFPTLTLGIALALGYLGLGAGSGAQPSGLGIGHLGWGILSWVVLGIVAAARISGRWQGRRAALGSIAAFAAIALVYLLLSLLDANANRFL